MQMKTIIIAIVLVLVTGVSASAAGKLDVTQENFFVFDSYGSYGYTFARVDNVGDKPITVHAGIVEIFDENGDTLTSTDYLDMYAQVLQPNEYTYVSSMESLDASSPAEVDDYLLTVTGKSGSDYIITRYPVTTDYKEVVVDEYYTYNYMYATVTNGTDEPVYGIVAVMALLDEEENILYIDSSSLYNVGLEPGSSVTLRCDVYEEYIEMLTKQGFTPTHVDAIAYTQEWAN